MGLLSLIHFLFGGLDLSNRDPNHPVQCWAREGVGSSGSGFGFPLFFQTGVWDKMGLPRRFDLFFFFTLLVWF